MTALRKRNGAGFQPPQDIESAAGMSRNVGAVHHLHSL